MALDVAPVRTETGGPTPPPPVLPGPGPRRRRPETTRLLVRLHFLSGFLAAPIILSLAVTGILFAWNPQIESALHDKTLSASSVDWAEPKPLSEQVEAARAEHPGWTVTAVTPAAPDAFEGRETTAVALAPPGGTASGFGHAPGAVSVYVDPVTGEVTGEIVEDERPGEWLRNMHSSWRLGDNIAPLSELAASWLLVSILTGIYLKWPTIRRSFVRAFSFRGARTPYARANALHTTLGLWLTVALLSLVGTGLTWTNFAGSRVDDLRATFSNSGPSLDASLPGGAPLSAPIGGAHNEHAEHNGGSDVPSDASGFDAAAVLPQIDTVARSAESAGLDGLVKYTPPTAEGKGWKAELRDTKWPLEPTTIAVDGNTGTVLDRVDWDEKPWMDRATSAGIYFHQATLFGIWTQLFLTALSIGVIVLIVAGYRMWWIRRPRGTLGVPPRVSGPLWKTVPVPMMVVFGLLAYALPTLAVSFLLYLVIERIWRSVRRGRAATHA
ncbi:PepSY-associated TM helix domain-containing protein [Sporichthya polymorpha]|uniref:PepSY-associated TM helix domain-containing protein n=1 Tax=Sporichthya polymorpha TaxID=35751 RepID=UPI000362EDB5|nr:PepSY domain-containing protein [Sporichthya polymorpha]